MLNTIRNNNTICILNGDTNEIIECIKSEIKKLNKKEIFYTSFVYSMFRIYKVEPVRRPSSNQSKDVELLAFDFYSAKRNGINIDTEKIRDSLDDWLKEYFDSKCVSKNGQEILNINAFKDDYAFKVRADGKAVYFYLKSDKNYGIQIKELKSSYFGFQLKDFPEPYKSKIKAQKEKYKKEKLDILYDFPSIAGIVIGKFGQIIDIAYSVNNQIVKPNLKNIFNNDILTGAECQADIVKYVLSNTETKYTVIQANETNLIFRDDLIIEGLSFEKGWSSIYGKFFGRSNYQYRLGNDVSSILFYIRDNIKTPEVDAWVLQKYLELQ